MSVCLWCRPPAPVLLCAPAAAHLRNLYSVALPTDKLIGYYAVSHTPIHVCVCVCV